MATFDVRKAYEEDQKKKKDNERTFSDDLKAIWYEQNGEAVAKDIMNRLTKYQQDANSLAKEYNSRLGRDRYQADASYWVDSVTKRKEAMSTDYKYIQDIMNQYGDYFDNGWTSGISSALGAGELLSRDVLSGAKSNQEFWSQWKDEDSYNAWVSENKKQEQMKVDDLDALSAELEKMRSRLEGARQEYSDLSLGVTGNATDDPAVVKRFREVDAMVKELENGIAEKEVYLRDATRVQNGLRLASAVDSDDFNHYAEIGANIENPTIPFNFQSRNPDDWRKFEDEAYKSGNPVTWERSNRVGQTHAYDFMTDDEVAIYNYYMGKGDRESADLYLDALTPTLNSRHAKDKFEFLEGNTVMELLFGLEAGLDQFSTGVQRLGKLISGDSSITDTTATQLTSAMVREDLADDSIPFWYNFKTGEWEDKILGASIGQTLYDATTTGANMAPSILAAVASNFLAPGSGAFVGTALMGGSASGNAYQEVINLGYGEDEATAYGIAVGLSEALLQNALGGIGKLGGTSAAIAKAVEGIDNGLLKFCLRFGGKIGSEALEEGLQEVLDPLFKNAILGTNESVNLSDVTYSALLGGMMGGTFGGVELIGDSIKNETNSVKVGESILKADGGVAALKNLSEVMYGVAPAKTQKKIKKLSSKVTDAKTIGNQMKVGKLYNLVESTMTGQNITDITKSLVQKGLSKIDAKVLAGAIAVSANGMELNEVQRNVLKEFSEDERVHKTIQELVLNEKSTVRQTRKKVNTFAREIVTNTVGLSQYGKQAESIPTSNYEVSAEGKTVLKSTGETVNIEGIASIEDGKMTLKLDNGKTVDSANVCYATSSDAIIYSTVANMDISPSAAMDIINGFKTKEGISAEQYALGIQEAYGYGKYGARFEDIGSEGFAVGLNETTRKYAYNLGKMVLESQGGNNYNNIKSTEVTENGTGEGVHLRGSVQRTDSESAGRPVRGVVEGTGTVQNRQEETTGRSGNGSQNNGTTQGQVSSKGLGVLNGSENKNLSTYVKNKQALREALNYARKHGLRLTAFTGGNLVINDSDGSYEARAYIRGRNVVVRADHPQFNLMQLLKHEVAHHKIRTGKVDMKKVYTAMAEKATKSGCSVDDLISTYVLAYAGLQGYSNAYVLEEILCDYEAGMNIFDGSAKATEIIETAIALANSETYRMDSVRGPPIEGKSSREAERFLRNFTGEIKTDEYISLSRVEYATVRSNIKSRETYLDKNAVVGLVWAHTERKQYAYAFTCNSDYSVTVTDVYDPDIDVATINHTTERMTNYARTGTNIQRNSGVNGQQRDGNQRSHIGSGVDAQASQSQSAKGLVDQKSNSDRHRGVETGSQNSKDGGANTTRNTEEVTNGETHFSREYWKPKLTKAEWSLLNRTMEQEIETSDKYIDEATKWLYANSKGESVFAIYGIGDGAVPTLLYADGQKKATADYEKLTDYLEEKYYGIDETGINFGGWLKIIPDKQGESSVSVYANGKRIAAKGNDLVSVGTRERNGTGNFGSGTKNSVQEIKLSRDTKDSTGRELTPEQAKNVDNPTPTQNPDIRFSREYSYEWFTQKPDMVVTTLDGKVPKNRANVVHQAKQNAAKIGKFNTKDGSVSVHVDDIDTDVVLGTRGLQHGLDRRFAQLAPVTLKAGEILKHSIRMNEMVPKMDKAKESYVLIGTAQNKNGELYIVQSVVNRFKNELVSMDILYAINAKKDEPAGRLAPRGGQHSGSSPSGSTISIAELLEYVNEYFSDVLPEDVLKHFGHDSRPEGSLSENILYSREFKEGGVVNDTRGVQIGIDKTEADDSGNNRQRTDGRENRGNGAGGGRGKRKIWIDLSARRRAQINKAVEDCVGSSTNYLELRYLLADFVHKNVSDMTLKDKQEAILILAEKIHSDILVHPVVAEQKWSILGNDIGKLVSEIQKISGNAPIRFSREFSLSPQTDLDVLEKAAENAGKLTLTAGERYALETFKLKLDSLGRTRNQIAEIKSKDNPDIKDQNRLNILKDKEARQRSDLWKLFSYPVAKAITQQTYEELVNKYKTIKPGEKPAREAQVPKRISDDAKVSQTIRTVMEAQATSDEMVETLQQKVVEGKFSYIPVTNKIAKTAADEIIQRKGWDDAYSDWMMTMGSGRPGKKDIALGWQLYNNAVNAGNEKTAIKILTTITATVRTSAQVVQAVRILKQLSPDNRMYALQRSLDALQDKLNKRYGEKAPKIDMDSELAKAYRDAKTEEEIQSAQKNLYRDIALKIPRTFTDIWDAWRYLAMLCNLRTHVRNIGGSAAFVPFRKVKNVIAAGLESAYAKNHSDFEKTKSVGRDKDLYAWAKEDYETSFEFLTGVGKYDDTLSEIEKLVPAFGAKNLLAQGLTWLAEKNAKALDTEDMWFAKPAYADSLSGFLKARDISAEDIRANRVQQEVMDEARAYAIQEALKATYRDANEFSDAIAKMGRSANNSVGRFANRVFMEGTLPYRRTPANILVRAVGEYSPVGLGRGIKKMLRDVKKGTATPAEAIDLIASGLEGSAVILLGWLFASFGLVSAGGDDDKKQEAFDELRGGQGYAMQLPGGKNITIDWLAPIALPFFVGVEIHEASAGGLTFSEFTDALGRIAEPILELSMLSGAQELLDNVSYSDNKLMTIMVSAATSQLTQLAPTLFGQIERITETQREQTFIDRNSWMSNDLQYTLGKLLNKSIGEYNQIPYIDAWGRRQDTGTLLERIFNNMLNPGYVSEDRSTAFDDELQRLYDAGYDGVFPSRVSQSQKVDGKYLTADQYVAYSETKGQTQHNILAEMISSDWYAELGDFERAECIKAAYDYANDVGKKAADSNYALEGWIKTAHQAAQQGVSVVDSIRERANSKSAEWAAKRDYPDYDWNESIANKWQSCQMSGIPIDIFLDAYRFAKDAEANKNANGNTISGSKKAKIVNYINRLNISKAQKKALWNAVKDKSWSDKDVRFS